MLDSSGCGSVVALPYGGTNTTFAEIPEHPFSPRGLASDMSMAIGWMNAQDAPPEACAGAKMEREIRSLAHLWSVIVPEVVAEIGQVI